MKHIFEPLRQEYDRWQALLNDNSPLPEGAVSIEEVLRAHFLLCDYFIREGEAIATPGPRDKILLGSAISRQASGFAGKLKWSNPLEMTATLFYGLVKNHPFHDGNKRTALLVALHQLIRFGRLPDASQKDFETLVVRTAANELSNYSTYKKHFKKHSDEIDARVAFIADFFQRKSRRSDSRFYAITFNELATLLPRFGFQLSNPSGNFIDIVRPQEESYGFLRLKKRVVHKKICQIGYPGGTKEVGAGAISTIRRECGLTSLNGIDSQVFFKDADPLSSLIARYHKPLLRLKDK